MLQQLPFTSVASGNNKLSGAVLYPNPATESVSLSMPASGKIRTVQIYDMQGSLKKEFVFGTNQPEVVFSISDLPKGIYLLMLQASRETEYIKFVKK